MSDNNFRISENIKIMLMFFIIVLYPVRTIESHSLQKKKMQIENSWDNGTIQYNMIDSRLCVHDSGGAAQLKYSTDISVIIYTVSLQQIFRG